MKLIHYLHNDKKNFGVLVEEDKKIIPLREISDCESNDVFDVINYFEKNSINEILSSFEKYSDKAVSIGKVKVLAPIEYPKRNMFCLGKNYLEHAIEMEGKTTDKVSVPTKPIYFSKLSYPAIGPDDLITGHVGVSSSVDYEVELAIIIGKEGSNIKKTDVESHIFGYTIVNDISARDLQIDHIQWYRAKSLDGFCPMGPVILHKSAIAYPPKLEIKSYINDELRQNGLTTDLIFDIDYIISDLSKGITLLPGDIIITGTPAGVGMGYNPPKYLKSGDKITCEIEKIGLLTNTLK